MFNTWSSKKILSNGFDSFPLWNRFYFIRFKIDLQGGFIFSGNFFPKN